MRRVKLAYTVELEEIPEKVKEFLEQSVHGLATASSDLMDVTVVEHVDITLGKIDNIRQRLALVDSRLEDCYVALVGYNHAKMNEHMPPQEEPVAQPPAVSEQELRSVMGELQHLRAESEDLEKELNGAEGEE
jgi:hypothetical protein